MDTSAPRFTLDERTRLLIHGTESVHLSPKAFDLLALLVRRRPEAVSKADIHQRLWPDTFVSDVNLAVLIGEIRTALGENARCGASVRTVHRFGYAFSGTMDVIERSAPVSDARMVCAIEWNGTRTALAVGEHLVGRDPTAHVHIDAFGVSRRHAVLVVTDRTATLRDLSSKNGTFVDDVRVRATAVLPDDAEIRLGPVPIRFRRLSALQPSTETWDTTSR